MYKETINYIAEKAGKLLENKGIREGFGTMDYVAIFPKTEKEHDKLIEIMQGEGLPIAEVPTGTVFQLHQQLETSVGIVPRVRIRIFDKDKTQRGYVDYATDNYDEFKQKYLPTGSLKIVHNNEGVEMLLVQDPKYDVFVYFPEIPLGKKLEQ